MREKTTRPLRQVDLYAAMTRRVWCCNTGTELQANEATHGLCKWFLIVLILLPLYDTNCQLFPPFISKDLCDRAAFSACCCSNYCSRHMRVETQSNRWEETVSNRHVHCVSPALVEFLLRHNQNSLNRTKTTGAISKLRPDDQIRWCMTKHKYDQILKTHWHVH